MSFHFSHSLDEQEVVSVNFRLSSGSVAARFVANGPSAHPRSGDARKSEIAKEFDRDTAVLNIRGGQKEPQADIAKLRKRLL